jgi:hypothetical protein
MGGGALSCSGVKSPKRDCLSLWPGRRTATAGMSISSSDYLGTLAAEDAIEGSKFVVRTSGKLYFDHLTQVLTRMSARDSTEASYFTYYFLPETPDLWRSSLSVLVSSGSLQCTPSNQQTRRADSGLRTNQLATSTCEMALSLVICGPCTPCKVRWPRVPDLLSGLSARTDNWIPDRRPYPLLGLPKCSGGFLHGARRRGNVHVSWVTD